MNAFTEAGERRSEFPWRSTGFTALPRHFEYRAFQDLGDFGRNIQTFCGLG